jgi:hypothetical protein
MRAVYDTGSRNSGSSVLACGALAMALALRGAGSSSPWLWLLTQPAVHHERADALKATWAHNLLKQKVNTLCLCLDWYIYLLNKT